MLNIKWYKSVVPIIIEDNKDFGQNVEQLDVMSDF